MDTVTILQLLWRMRALVAATAVVAIGIGGLTAYRPGFPPQSRQYQVGVASARILVDTPNSQLANLGLKEDANAGVLPARAVLLANLMTTSPIKNEIARRAGVKPDRLIAVADTPTDSGASVDKPLTTGVSVKPTDPDANVLTAHTDLSLPLITVNTQAPDPAVAARLANSAFAVLEAHIASLTTDQSVPSGQRLVITRLGAAGAGLQTRGPSRLLAIATTLILFLIGCALLLLIAKLALDWQARAAAQDQQWAETAWDVEAGLRLAGSEQRAPPDDEPASDDMVA